MFSPMAAKRMDGENKMKSYATKLMTFSIFFFVVLFTMTYCAKGYASECRGNCGGDTNNYNITILHKHSDLGKGFVIGVITTCRFRAGYVGFTEGRWFTWCGEDKPRPEPLPDGGPSVKNDVTPSPTGVRLYQ